jgi:hypothetical protein
MSFASEYLRISLTREGRITGAMSEQIAAAITKSIPVRRRGTPGGLAHLPISLALK